MSKGLFSLDLLKEHQRYPLKDGSCAPGVTTVLNATCPKPQLINWANDEGLAGRDVRKIVREAADLGSITHARIEALLRGYDGLDPAGLPPELVAQSEHGYQRFVDWWKDSGLDPVAVEHQMVSEYLRVGGTADIIARDRDGRLALVDLKTSKAIYREHQLQAAAYKLLWDEHADPHQGISSVLVWRVGKSEGDAGEILELKQLAACEQAFRTAVAHYYALKAVSNGRG